MVKVLAERGTGRLLGCHIVGIEGAAKRIDVLATALYAGFTGQEVIRPDLGYAPPTRRSGIPCSSPPGRPSTSSDPRARVPRYLAFPEGAA